MSWVDFARLAVKAAGGRRPVGADETHLRAAVSWLLEAQRVAGGGYAHSFHLRHGWRPPYPETTGYIMPTLHAAHRRHAIPGAMEFVATAARWLIANQQPDGSFLDLQGRKQVFDTGQVLIGFNFLAEHASELGSRAPLERAARWLAAVQEKNGSFVAHAYNNIPHSYYARVGAALVAAGRILGDESLREAGVKNLRWTIAQQEANGFFRHLSFDASPPYLHTMAYAIEGLVDGHAESGDQSLLTAALAFAEKLHEVSQARDRILRSQYRADYSVANGEKCLTGLAQWAGACFRFARLTRDENWRREGTKTLDFLKAEQILCADRRLNGGLFGSAPFYGRYMRVAIPNWGVKFFIDALLEKDAAL